MSERQFKRHATSDIVVHWFNAVCWFLLLISGVGLISNKDIAPLGQAYPHWIRAMAGDGGALLFFHEVVGIIWMAGLLLYVLVNFKGAMFFLREIFTVSPGRDMAWMIRKMVLMTLGPKALKKAGMPAKLPDQGYYNMGQKAFAQASVLGGIVIAATGIVMFLSDRTMGPESVGLVGWAITLHYLAVGLVFAGLLVHIYMAAISPDERPGFKSMFTGSVPEGYARHHHKLWYDKVAESAKAD